MKGLVTISLLVLLSCQIGYSLRCYVCAHDNCQQMTCLDGQVCGKVTANGVTAKSCVPANTCDNSIDGVKAYCCSTDLCNSAVSTRMSFGTIIAVLVVFWVTKLSST
ncbi:alpha-neurotoxin homolog 1-like [Spea bombifrons]|uniref:alpha-neurotoxin homolog 1-like n=1 Tax=Spea bombifrons TaxID=233779 RepID=UPI002349360A|nr:alpha-neurotoxin homolog 1-like [Spea bombifrons]